VELRTPRVNDRRRDEQGQRQRFTSSILPPYMRRSPKVAEVLPIAFAFVGYEEPRDGYDGEVQELQPGGPEGQLWKAQ